MRFAICILIFFITTCSYNRTNLELSLEFAGDNRSELENVLQHYSTSLKDSLKLKAASYLIENMRYYYSLKNEKLEFFKSKIYSLSIEHNWSPRESLNYLQTKYGKLNLHKSKKEYDLHVITAEYLIQNIEHAFKVWENAPWRERISFDEFCEEILPHRIGNEPLEQWRDNYSNNLRPIVDTFKYNTDPLKVYTLLMDTVLKTKWLFDQELHLSHLGANILLNNHYGYCRDMCDFGVYIMRALGLPGGTDLIVQHADDSYGMHMWNYIRDSIGNPVDVDMIVANEKVYIERKKGRVYRLCYAIQGLNETLVYPKNKYIPKWLYNSFIKDVSEYYFPFNKIIISTEKYGFDASIIYLGVFNNKQWVPIVYKMNYNNQVTFQHLDTTVMYMPLYYSNNEFIPFGGAFNIKSDNSIFLPRANHEVLKDMLLLRKHRIPHWWNRFGNRSWNGRFQGANSPDFSDAVDLHIIDYQLEMKYYYIDIKPKSKFQYIRYMSGFNGHNNMAEMNFWDMEKKRKLTGVIIGSEGSFKNDIKRTKNAVFDNDPITFYDANEKNGAWVGYRFDNPQQIDVIQFLFRNDDNNIRIGDEYELFYLENNCKWKSMGKKTATDIRLIYRNVPSNTLYLLKNHTRGIEERIFTYENNEQIWW